MWYYWFQTFHKWISTLAAESRIIVPAAISVQNATFSRTSYMIHFPIPMHAILKTDNFYLKCVAHYLIFKDIFSGLVLGFAVITFNNYNLNFLVNVLSEAYLKQSWQKYFHVYNRVKSMHGTPFPIGFRNTGESRWEYDQRRDRAWCFTGSQVFTEINIKINGFKEILKVFHWRFNVFNIFIWPISFSKMFSKKSTNLFMLANFSFFMLNHNSVKVHKWYNDIFNSLIYLIFDALQFTPFMFADSYLIWSAFPRCMSPFLWLAASKHVFKNTDL